MKIMYRIIASGACLLSVAGCDLPWSRKKNEQSAKTGVIISLVGAPLSGKGTLTQRAIDGLGFVSLSTGNLLREYVASDKPGSQELEAVMKSGQLVPDETINKLVEEWLDRHLSTDAKIILDGYPRSRQQAEMLVSLLKNKFAQCRLTVVALDIPDYILIKRAVERLFCPQCQATFNLTQAYKEHNRCPKCRVILERRKDDAEDVVCARLKLYHEKSCGIFEYYKSQAGIDSKELSIDEKTPPDTVFENFKKLIEADMPTGNNSGENTYALPTTA